VPDPFSYTRNTQLILEGLASLNPATVAAMHGSSFTGDCRKELLGLGTVMREVLDKPSYQFWGVSDPDHAQAGMPRATVCPRPLRCDFGNISVPRPLGDFMRRVVILLVGSLLVLFLLVFFTKSAASQQLTVEHPKIRHHKSPQDRVPVDKVGVLSFDDAAHKL
jgi:hypothetical protein